MLTLTETTYCGAFWNENLRSVRPLWHLVGNLWVRLYTSFGQVTYCTLLCVNVQPQTTSPLFFCFSPSVHNPSLQPSLFFTTNPSYIRLPKLLFSSGTHCCVRKLWEQRVGHLSPYTANGHPRNASSLWVWAAANHVASQCHRGAETTKRRSTFSSFIFPKNKRLHFVPIMTVHVEVV